MHLLGATCYLCCKRLAQQLHPKKMTKQLDLFGVVLFSCSRFCHPPRSSIVWLWRAPLPGICSIRGALLCCIFCGLQICSCQLAALCWKLLPSCTLRQRAFPIFPSVLVLHRSNVSILYLLQWLNCILASFHELKIGALDVWGVCIIWLCKNNWFYGLRYNR